MDAPPTANGGPASRSGDRRAAVITAAVCLASAATLLALFAGRPVLTGTARRLSTDSSASEASLEHYQEATRRRSSNVWPLADPTAAAVPPPNATALAAGPRIQELAKEMTERALELLAAEPGRVQLLPQPSPLPPPAHVPGEGPGPSGPSTAGNSASQPDVLGQAVGAAEGAAVLEQADAASQAAEEAAAFAMDAVANATGSNGFEPATPRSTTGRPDNLTMTLLVFFGPGRQAIQRVMQCYVQRNLVVNGGIVSDVIWEAHEGLEAADLAFLQEIINLHPEQYRMKLLPAPGPDEARFQRHYADLDPSRFYVKMDDDVVWLADGALEAMLEEKLRGNYLYISGNIINHSSMGLMHARLGLLNGYLPTSKGRPWVASRDTSYLDGSPAEGIDDSVMGRAWGSWEMALIQHYNFFRHWRDGSCDGYQQLPTYDLHAQGYVRWSITLILFKSSELGEFVHGDDEALISKDFPAAAGQHCAAAGSAVAAHYAYYTQRPGLGRQPEVLGAYTRIAEAVCGALVG